MPDSRLTDRSFLARHPVEAGYDLIGYILRVERDGVVTSGRIVECEAYAGPLDAASHTARLKVARDVMSREPGTVYTFVSYGMHTMMNIVAHAEDASGAALIRAVEPVDGIEVMRERRGPVPDQQLGKGPGNLCAALGIRMDDMGDDVILSSRLSLHEGWREGDVHAGPRIGITKAVQAPWRFYEAGNPNVSSHRKAAAITIEELRATIPPPGVPVD